jgi:1-deoxy-D-xylulose-5-phosphate synthase
MLADVRYNRIKAAAEKAGHRLHMTPLRRIYHLVERAIKSLWLQNAFFEAFGLRYVGPIDGHDFVALENALHTAREDKRSVLIHVATQKGRGYRPSERSPGHWHGVGAFDLDSGQAPEGHLGYSQVFGSTLATWADGDASIFAITAAMCGGTGLDAFARRHSDRFFDVGICEGHAVVFAAGLAASGYRPFFAVYSTFLQRAVDCVMHDVCLPNLPVVFCLDRAGVVGSDGPTHHGIYDIPMLRCLPNLAIMQPKDASELVSMLKLARLRNGPTVIRYPRDPGPAVAFSAAEVQPIPLGRADVVQEPLASEKKTGTVWLWALGDFVPLALATAARLASAGVRVGVVNARFVKPLDAALLAEQVAAGAALFATLENGAIRGGFGSAVAETLSASGAMVPVLNFGWPDAFVGQGTTRQLLEDGGLTAERLSEAVLARLANIGIASGAQIGEN